MKYFIFIIVLLALVVFFFWNSREAATEKQSYLQIEDRVEYQIEVVSDAISQARGLSGRESLTADTGMLFVFSRPKIQNFWMNEMLIPLDVLWIQDYTVIGVSENVLPPTETDGVIERMKSPSPANMVLEVNAGDIQKYGIQVGDTINIDKK